MSENDKQQSMEAGEIARFLSYIVLLLASVALFVSAGHIPSSMFETLGAGAFPRFVFGTIILVAFIAVIDSLRKIPRDAWSRFGASTRHWIKTRFLVILCFGIFVSYLVVLPILGFSVASFVFVLAIQLLLMPRSPITILIAVFVALAFSFGLNALFADVFNVFLPRGDLFHG
ncbi:tripartite tricarboxylate transporter TctB family protein [Roseibium sp.]|uniref:tripartite tricarboxylate transporter TctB family protein n=1 Tax=Roseibium sp. TaxID=1936156 RepID=UPI003D0D50B8